MSARDRQGSVRMAINQARLGRLGCRVFSGRRGGVNDDLPFIGLFSLTW